MPTDEFVIDSDPSSSYVSTGVRIKLTLGKMGENMGRAREGIIMNAYVINVVRGM